MNKLKVFEALVSCEDDGLFVMSLVDAPATEVNWFAFNKQDEQLKFSIINEEEHMLQGVVMLAETPIYRRNEDGFEYYIKYSKETLKVLAEKMLKDNTHNNIDLQHNGQLLPKDSVNLVELFVKDVEKGINPNHFENVPDGSLLCTYKINNEELWEMCKNGTFNGFSLEGMFTIKDTNEKFSEQSKSNIMKTIKEKLRTLLMSFNSQVTDKGELFYEGEELVVDTHVEDKDGNPIEDGEYVTDDTIYVVENSTVIEVKEVEKPTEEPTEEVEPTVEAEEEQEEVVDEVVEETVEDETPSEIEELKAEIEVLKKQVEEILAKISEPAVEPIVEEFAAVQKENAFDNKLNKAMRIASKLK